MQHVIQGEVLSRLTKYEKQLKGLKQEDYRYSYTKDMVEYLKGLIPKPEITLHNDSGDNLCESCQ